MKKTKKNYRLSITKKLSKNIFFKKCAERIAAYIFKFIQKIHFRASCLRMADQWPMASLIKKKLFHYALFKQGLKKNKQNDVNSFYNKGKKKKRKKNQT